ncbi:MAG: GTPase Era [Gammaproteobacteria bacterium]|nr:GTPase Era [Gammaproteobacteria bacterium]MDH3466782.1 GTPase Era [Gammaproteobacteria bacterium]
MTDDPYRSGTVALIGAPNAGKSTLLNSLVGRKISITSRRPQTTRNRVIGVRTSEHTQLILVDTPGMHAQQTHQLNRVINRNARNSLDEVDIIVLVITASGWQESDEFPLHLLEEHSGSVVLAINKIDRLAQKEKLLPLIKTSNDRRQFTDIVPISALRGDNIDTLIAVLRSHLPIAEAGYPADQFSGQSDKFLSAELIREQLFEQLGQELPYATAVELEEFSVGGDRLAIGAVIWVNKASQKPIVLGRGGSRIREIGRRARLQIEQNLGTRVHLSLWVKVREGWADNAVAVRALGYSEE